ncbi:UNVERIFIED_ORG: antirestriction protein ArdC [Variovorax paradoxus]|nr:antirestriction protein ArdC [Variovorax paradoxus]
MDVGIDVRRAVTDRIMAMLAEGEQACRQRWIEGASRGMPRNAGSGRSYAGVNALLLWDAAIARGYGVSLWLTYRQAKALGAQVRKGERGVLCAQFERDGGGGDGDPGSGSRNGFLLLLLLLLLRCSPFWLFNVAQVDGMLRNCLAARAGASLACRSAGAIRWKGRCAWSRAATQRSGMVSTG